MWRVQGDPDPSQPATSFAVAPAFPAIPSVVPFKLHLRRMYKEAGGCGPWDRDAKAWRWIGRNPPHEHTRRRRSVEACSSVSARRGRSGQRMAGEAAGRSEAHAVCRACAGVRNFADYDGCLFQAEKLAREQEEQRRVETERRQRAAAAAEESRRQQEELKTQEVCFPRPWVDRCAPASASASFRADAAECRSVGGWRMRNLQLWSMRSFAGTRTDTSRTVKA